MDRFISERRPDPRRGARKPSGGGGRFGLLLALIGAGLLGAAATELYDGWSAQKRAREKFSQGAPARSTPVPELPTGRSLSSWIDSAGPSEQVAEETEDIGARPPAPGTPGPADGDLVGRLRIPSAGVDLAVFEGIDATVLRKGPGHVPGTSLPTRGSNCVIAAHRDSFFRPLERVKVGDAVFLSGDAGEREYRLTSRRIVTPDAVEVMAPTGKEQLTLVTCYPFRWIGPAPYRVVWQALPATPGDPPEALAEGPTSSTTSRR